MITAAHCVDGKNLPRNSILTHVRLGDWDRDQLIDCDPTIVDEKICNQPIEIAIESKIVHRNYDKHSLSQQNDIALLRLSETVPFTRYIRPICLPLNEKLQSANFAGKTMTIAGWGEHIIWL